MHSHTVKAACNFWYTVSVKKSFNLLTGKFIPVAYGVQKLQISCVVEDDKVGTDFLEEKITEFEDIVSKIFCGKRIQTV